ncbi:hypothetical protein SprV_0802481400 [Sparganum proliferum]
MHKDLEAWTPSCIACQRSSKRTFELTPAALTSFEQVKALLADATLLTHYHADAPISLMVDASNVAVGAVLQQSLPDSTVPLAFFSKKLSKAETRYSTFGRELLAAYLAVRHFRHLLEGRDFTIFTDHKPLTFALRSHTDKLNPREIRQLDYISQFTSDIRHIDGSRNEVADALSRPSIAHLQLSPGIDLAEMAAEQRRVGSPCDEDVSGLQLQDLPLTTGNGIILCDVSTPSHRPFVPPSLRRKVFSSLHNLSHPGSRATDKLVSDRFVWPGMHKDLKAWTRACLGCQRSKIQRHNKAPIGTFPGPGARFSHVHLDIVGPLPLSNGCTRIRTTVFQLAANGMVERFHRQLKASQRAATDSENWTDHLPLFLLGIRPALKAVLHGCAAETVFGATVRLPGEIISPTPRVAVEDLTNFLHRLRQFLRTLSPVSPRPSVSDLRTFFPFDGTIYEQVKDTPMTTPISGFIAEAVLQRLESLAFQHNKPKFWARYVDDTFVVIEWDQVLTFQEHLNAVFPHIHFTMKKEENNQRPS